MSGMNKSDAIFFYVAFCLGKVLICRNVFLQVTHHHSHYSAPHPTHSGHSLVGSIVGAASRGYPTPTGGPVTALHHAHASPPPVHTTHYNAHHQLSQQV